MNALRSIAALAVVLAVVLAPSLGQTRSGGAAPGFAGDPIPGEPQALACNACHTSFPLNSGAGGVAIDAPTAFGPGETVRVTVTVDNQTQPDGSGGRRQGFEAVVKDAATDEVVGTVALVDASNTRFASSREEYVTHTSGGTSQTAWAFDWTAPESPAGPVRIYAAGNAANGNGSSSGDRIYTATADLAPASTAATSTPGAPAFDVGGPHPNPARGGIVRLAVVGADGVAARLVDGRGRVVRDLGTSRAGALTVSTAGLAPGLYFVVASGPGGRRTQPLVIAR